MNSSITGPTVDTYRLMTIALFPACGGGRARRARGLGRRAPGGGYRGAMAERDRDAEGRARNSRARDAYGRPLPRGVPGEPTVPDAEAAALARNPVAALAEAQRLLDADRPFHAHEVLEAVWKTAPARERAMWRGLAQAAVGLTHLRRGNPGGAHALLTRSATVLALDPAAGAQYGLDLPELVTRLRELADRIENQDPDLGEAGLVLVSARGTDS